MTSQKTAAKETSVGRGGYGVAQLISGMSTPGRRH